MHDNRSHPLLEQVPLTVSPFVHLPTATTLPYTYKQMPSSLPPSAAGIISTSTSGDPSSTSSEPKPKYVISTSGHAAHPDDIIASCRALEAHISKLASDAERALGEFDERIKARDLAEKRRLAPGWLDSDVRVLEPERKGVAHVLEGTESGIESLTILERMDGAGVGGFGNAGGYGGGQGGHGRGGASEMAVPDEGEELDRAFGGIGLGK